MMGFAIGLTVAFVTYTLKCCITSLCCGKGDRIAANLFGTMVFLLFLVVSICCLCKEQYRLGYEAGRVAVAESRPTE